MIWTEQRTVAANDVDVNNIVSASVMLRYMQDAANNAMRADGPSYEELIESGYTFILARISLSFYTPLHSHDELEIQTWAVESRGVQMNRCYRILRDGIIMAEAAAVWALCGIEDRKPHRVSEFDLHYRTDAMLELDLPARLRIPEEAELHLVGERTVEYADIDLNGHMNNTRYPDIMCGFLEQDMQGQRVISICLSYLSEASYGETIKYYTGTNDGYSYVRSVRPGGSINAEAEIMTEAI